MSAALRWLGGLEAEVLNARAVETMQGTWQDGAGTIYVLTCSRQKLTFDVLTLRPCGARRFTRGLVQCRDHAKPITFAGRAEDTVFWGKSRRKFAAEVEGACLTWRRAGSAAFHWEKLQ